MKQVVITIEDDEEKMNKEIQNKLILDACCGIPYKPLFGHTTGRQSKTIWMSFMK